MTRDEILALSDEDLQIKAALHLGWTQISRYIGRKPTGVLPGGYEAALPDYPHSIAAAWELFNAVYDKRSPLYGGVWVLSTVDDGKNCSQATLYLRFPRGDRPLTYSTERYRATGPVNGMARAVTLVYVMAMEDAKA